MREPRFKNLSDGEPLDVLIVGGGITGAPLYHQLCRSGYRTALIDKGDFSSGTSQASGMLVWGGLLYLKNLDLLTVRKLCRARNGLLRDFPGDIARLNLHFQTAFNGRISQAAILLGLYLYWFLGNCALNRPSVVRSPKRKIALSYQEGMLRESDSRFVLDWIRAFDSEQCIPLNYCRLTGGEFDPGRRLWSLAFRDELTGREETAQARIVINCGGVWTDEINRLLAIQSPYKHVLSKGVYLAFPGNEAQKEAVIYPMPGKNDVLTSVPWGPVTMWGPTETAVPDLELALAPDRDDIRFLLAAANRSLERKVGPEDIVSMRCGIRPLAVDRGYSSDAYPLDLSRSHRVAHHHERGTIAVYGGKLTSGLQLAHQVSGLVRQWIVPRYSLPPPRTEPPRRWRDPELEHDFVTAEWAREQEFCVTLEDYLRRRTPIAQWTPRMGLGRDDCHRHRLVQIAETFAPDRAEAEKKVAAYEQKVRSLYDPLLSV